ncbi:MAG: hypothetical protein IPG20_06855 [Gammaproteobacteria bacterium]|nr:hypothetical protein [Gammaproteobacteria bacterium]
MNHSNETLMEMMKRILRIRYFEEAIIDLKKKAEVPVALTPHWSRSHLVGACMASGDNSYMTGSHRSHGHPIAEGGRLNQLMAELMARTTGVCKAKGGSCIWLIFLSGVSASPVLLAAIFPMPRVPELSQLRGASDEVTLASSAMPPLPVGAFHESLNGRSLETAGGLCL